MTAIQQEKISDTLKELFADSKRDYLKMMPAMAKSVLRPIQPQDLKEAYLSISKEQGEDLVKLIEHQDLKHIVEFGTSFGISTIYLAKGALLTDGKVVTTELIESKAIRAMENFKKAGVEDLIDIKIGDASQTLKTYDQPVDLLLLDGWKNLYLHVFNLLEPNFHRDTIIYVDNADMSESREFLQSVSRNSKYRINYRFGGKVALITL